MLGIGHVEREQETGKGADAERVGRRCQVSLRNNPWLLDGATGANSFLDSTITRILKIEGSCTSSNGVPKLVEACII
jgi:hypothetical protein